MKITVETEIAAPIATVWARWTTPDDIMQWNAASADWACPAAELDLRDGGRFVYRMAAKDGSMAFDYDGTFLRVVEPLLLDVALGDRTLRVDFIANGAGTILRETFDPDGEMPAEMQRDGWQAILDNFKRHVESLG